METIEAIQEQVDLRDNFKIKFDGDQNQVDANTFVNYLIHFNTIVQEVNRELSSDRKIRVKIKALEKGSFIVNIELQSILDQLKTFFTKDNVEYAGAIIGIVVGLIEIKGFLGGRKAKAAERKGDQVVLTNEQGQVLQVNNIVNNIYITNTIVDQALTKQFETLEQDENIAGVELLNAESKPLLIVPREEFAALATPSEATEDRVTQDERKAMLSIVKLSFEPKLKSDFIYYGNRISAYIKDKAFYETVNKGKSFAKGDALEVKLQVNKIFDESLNTEVIKGYEILEVIRHVPRNDPDQLTLNLNT